MSYNTRRTGGGVGRGTSSTQVNYHQQPRNQAQRNSGYSTQSSYNTSSSQPAYSTQTGYSTSAPPPPSSQPKPAPVPAPAQSQPPPAAAPSPPQQQAVQSATPAPSSNVKQEPVTPAETPKMDTTENGEGSSSKPFWQKRKPFVKVSNKVRRARQNAKLRRILNPKNALTFLNELRPGGVKFIVREETGWGYVASVDIDGKSFTGHAMTVSKAKVQASEQALKHLLLEQLSKSQAAVQPPSENKEDTKETNDSESMDTEDKEDAEHKPKRARMEPMEDDLPWGSLAAFALHKLFDEWQKQGEEVTPVPPQDKYDEEVEEEAFYTRRPGPPPDYVFPRRYAPAPFGRGRGFPPYPPRGHPPPAAFGGPRRPPPPAAVFLQNTSPRPSLPLGGVPTTTIQPMKKIPEDANKRYPVMLLNQLKPNVIYNESREGDPPRVIFSISVEIDGKEYVGRGKSKKEAKKNAAKAALAPLGIIYPEDN